MTHDPEIRPDAVSLLSLCDLFSGIDLPELTPSHLDALKAEIEIVRLERGEVLVKQGDPADCMYVVVSGRFQVFVEGPDKERRLVGEVRSGETVGELGLIDGNPRMATVIASRNSQLVRVSAAGFNRLVLSNPDSLLKIARAEAARMRMMGQRRSPVATVRTIAVVGAGSGEAIHRFTAGICAALGEIGSVLHLTRSRYQALFGKPFDTDEAVAGWLSALESAHRFVVCEAEAEPSRWTMHSLRQADRILTIGDTADSPDLSAAERALSDEHKAGRMPPVELVLLHGNDGSIFPGTSRWLAPRHVLRHHHVRPHVPADLGRVARLLSGRAVGLALGGGGARGFAHIGALRAIEEAGISIDMVGGVSMGAIISALYAMGHDWRELIRLTKREMTRKLTDITLPIIALSTGRRFRRALHSFFSEIAIEDLGLGYFCSSCNLSTGEIVIHRTGLLSSAVQASNAIPVVLPPVLSGGDILIDGGVLNNQPGDILKELCGGSVIVSNVSPRRDATVDASLTEMPSAWRILRSRINPFEPTIRVPGIAATMMRTLTVASDRKSREVERMADFYLRPPLDRFRMDDFGRLEEIAEVGYEYARAEIRGWKESGRYPVPPNS